MSSDTSNEQDCDQENVACRALLQAPGIERTESVSVRASSWPQREQDTKHKLHDTP